MLTFEDVPAAAQANPTPDIPENAIPGGAEFVPSQGVGNANPGVFESVFGWIRDIIMSLFGGTPEGGDGEEVAVEDVEPIDVSEDIVLNAVLPPLLVEEEAFAEFEDDLDDELVLL